MKYFVLFTAMFFFSLHSRAQSNSKLLTGLILSGVDSRPLEGASVWVKGTKNYSGSQPDGIYYIAVEKTDSVLVFSLNGYARTEVRITGETEYNVHLQKLPVQPARSRPKQK